MICKYFLLCVDDVFTLVKVSFDAQKVFIWMNSSLSIFSFVACAFGVIAKASVVKFLPYVFL